MNLKNLLEYRILEFQNYSLTIAALVGLVVIYLTAWLILRFVKRLLDKGSLLHNTWDSGRRHSLFLILQYVVWILAATAMLETLGIHVTVLVAGSAAILVGLGLGIQQIFKDIVSGIFLLFEGTIEVGDVMQVGDKVGRVAEINLRTSKLATRDGVVMIVPNHKFITEDVLNWSHGVEKPVRFQVAVKLGYELDERIVRDLLIACALEHPDVFKDDPTKQPTVRLTEFEDEKMTFELLFWTLQKFGVESVRSDLRFAIRQKLREHSVRPEAMGLD